jgi:hypothetical protein
VSASERTPLPPDYAPGHGARELELSGRVPVLAEELAILTRRAASGTHTSESEADVSIVLDWATELRAREGMAWAQALYVAATFYYG